MSDNLKDRCNRDATIIERYMQNNASSHDDCSWCDDPFSCPICRKDMIKTSHVFPPIPIRTCDWVAYIDGNEEGYRGWGSTEAEAIENLKEYLEWD